MTERGGMVSVWKKKDEPIVKLSEIISPTTKQSGKDISNEGQGPKAHLQVPLLPSVRSLEAAIAIMDSIFLR